MKPELVAEVKFANWTAGRHLRAPVYLGLRDDVQPRDVHREVASPPARPKPFSDTANEVSLTIDGHPLKFTNLNKVFYPAEGNIKRDLLNYYDAVGAPDPAPPQRSAAVAQALSQRHRAAVLFPEGHAR